MLEVVCLTPWLAAGALLTGLSGLALLTPRPAGGGARLAVLGALLTHSGASAGHTGQHLTSQHKIRMRKIFSETDLAILVV